MIKTLGDVHLGKRFENDVPLNRRGERERMVMEQFKRELNPEGNIIHIQVGDLFDQFRIPNEVLKEAADAYVQAAQENPETDFILIPGNHDLARDADKVSSFQIFAKMVEHMPNIQVLYQPSVMAFRHQDSVHYIGFLPWHPFKTSDELAQELVAQYREEEVPAKLENVYCHCDLEDFSGHGTNVVPTKTLSEITSGITTGHVHTPDQFIRDGVFVIGTGSMQPYSHGEDPTNSWYITLTLDQMQSLPKEYLKNRYVRLKLSPTEEVTDIPDCLGFKIVPIDAPDDDEPVADIEVSFEDFNTRNLFMACLKELNISEEVTKTVLERFDENVQ